MKGWRTLGFNALAFILPLLESIDVTSVLDAKQMAVYTAGVAIGNCILRGFTNTKVGKAN